MNVPTLPDEYLCDAATIECTLITALGAFHSGEAEASMRQLGDDVVVARVATKIAPVGQNCLSRDRRRLGPRRQLARLDPECPTQR